MGTEGSKKNLEKSFKKNDQKNKNEILSDSYEISSVSSNNSVNLAVYSHEFNFQDPLERVGPKSGYYGITNFLL